MRFSGPMLANGYPINGTWTLETIDTQHGAPTTPAFVDFWTLNLSTGQTARSRRRCARNQWSCARRSDR